jgi:hypothetical protein
LQAWPAGHAPHAAPPFPQELFDSLVSASQLPPAVQQPAQEPPLPHVHAPLEHESPVPHAPHAAPPVPHSEVDCDPYGTQVLPLQQPPGQEVALHTHWPLALQT